jgi:hypothetical protein
MLFILLCYNITHPIQKLHALFTQEAKFNLAFIVRPNLQFVSLLFLIGSFMLPALFPTKVQRIYMAKNVLQAQKAFSYVTYIALPLTILMVLIGALLFAENPQLLPNQLLPYLKHQFDFPGFSALFCIAILALVMSTADSDLHAASVLVAHDVYHALNLKKINQLTLVRCTSIVLGIGSLALSFATDNLLLLTIFGYLIWQPALTIPVWMALFGFRTRPAVLFLSMATGLVTAFGWDYWMHWIGVSVYIPGVICGMLSNLCTLFLLHYMLPKLPDTGWVGIQNCTALEQQKQELERWWTHLGARLQALFSSSYWAGKLPREPRHYFSLGLYFIQVSLVALWYMNRQYFMPYIYWYMVVMAAGAICFAYPTLLSYKKRGYPAVSMAWPIALYILLFVSGKAFMLLGDYKPIVCFLFALNIVITLIFLPWSIVLAMTALVISVPNWFYGLPTVKSWELFLLNWQTDTTVSWVPLTILGYLFIVLHYKSRTQKLIQRLAQKELVQVSEHEALLEAIRHQKFYERQLPSGGGKALTNIEYELKSALKEQTLEKVRKVITFELAKLKGFKEFLLTKTYESQYGIELDKERIRPLSLAIVVEKVRKAIQALALPIKLLVRHHTTTQEIIVDHKKLCHLLVMTILGLSKKVEEDSILVLTIADTTLKYADKTSHNTTASDRVLPAIALHLTCENTQTTIESVYEVGLEGASRDFLKTITVDELYKYESMRIIDAHGGHSTIHESRLDMLYILPTNAKKVIREKTYKAEHLSVKIAETKESVAMEKRLQKLLSQKTQIPKKMVQETIQFIKEVHGHVLRKSGDPYYTHPMAVTEILLKETQDPDTLLAALLHDVVEDTQIPLHYLTAIYGPKIAGIVDGVTHLRNGIRRWPLSKEEEHKKVEVAIKKDVRVLLVKLADRLHNLYTVSCRKLEDQKRICKETVDFYIPLAVKANVGTKMIVPELKKLCDEILRK